MDNPSKKQVTENIQKKKVKGDIKFSLSLNEEQKEAKRVILENDITYVSGSYGSGKTLVCCAVALDQLFKKEVEKIIIARPMVDAGENMGYLPGDVKSKSYEWLIPIYDNLYQLYSKQQVDNLIIEGKIEICPLGMLRGRTYSRAFVIIDEVQNCTYKQVEGITSRLGKESKMTLCGDIAQVDLKDKKDSGVGLLRRFENKVPGFAVVKLTSNHRHPIVEHILKVCSELRD